MPEVVLLYDSDCPNVKDCRSNLIEAFTVAGKTPSWREVDRSSEDVPRQFRGYGSPTIIVNGSDVAGQEPGLDGTSCRLYQGDDGGYVGVPSVEQIAALLSGGFQGKGLGNGLGNGLGTGGSTWRQSLAVLPAVGAALLPSITCPACWPGYAAIFTSFGIGFLPSNRLLLPLTATFLVVYLLVLAWDARKRQRFSPLLVGTAASTLLVVGRFVFESNPLLYAGVALLITASIWNARPTLKTRWFAPPQAITVCPACQSGVQIDVTKVSKYSLDSGPTYGR